MKNKLSSKEKESNLNPEKIFEFSLNNLGISLNDQLPEEILYLQISNLNLTYR